MEQTHANHYVCTGGCNGVSEDPNAECGAEDCAKCKHQLVACNCADGEHAEAYAAAGSTEEKTQ